MKITPQETILTKASHLPDLDRKMLSAITITSFEEKSTGAKEAVVEMHR